MCVFFQSLPGSMKNLENVERLLLGANKLRALPHDIGNLQKLSNLWLEDNQLEALPESMTKLTSLQKVILGSLPVYLQLCLLNQPHLIMCVVTCLLQLKLSNNNLTRIPDITLCLELEIVHLQNNKLETIPDFSNMNRLKVLKLAENKLTSIHPGLGNLPALKDLSLNDNLLETVPPELGNLRVNPFSFSLNGNPLVSVPQEVLDLANVRESDFPLAQHVCDGLYIGGLGSAKNLR